MLIRVDGCYLVLLRAFVGVRNECHAPTLESFLSRSRAHAYLVLPMCFACGYVLLYASLCVSVYNKKCCVPILEIASFVGAEGLEELMRTSCCCVLCVCGCVAAYASLRVSVYNEKYCTYIRESFLSKCRRVGRAHAYFVLLCALLPVGAVLLCMVRSLCV